MERTFDTTTVMDSADQMCTVAASMTPILLDFFSDADTLETPSPSFNSLNQLRSRVATRANDLHERLRREFLTGVRGSAPASSELGKTRTMYEYIRKDLGVKMHGAENHVQFVDGVGEISIGQNISKIYEVQFLPSYCNLQQLNHVHRLFGMGMCTPSSSLCLPEYLTYCNLHLEAIPTPHVSYGENDKQDCFF